MQKKQLRNNLTLIGLLASTAILPVQANGFIQNSKALPDASHIYTAPLQADIVDMRMKVHDNRRADDDTTYEVNVAPPPTGHHHIVKIGMDGTVNSTNKTDAQTVQVGRAALPFAGLQSNIPAGPVLARQLPPGQKGHSMNLTGQINPKTAGNIANSARVREPIAINRVPQVLQVAPYQATAGGSADGSKFTKESLRGSLLGKSPE